MSITSGKIHITYGQYFVAGYALDRTEWQPERSNGLVAGLKAPGTPAVPGDFAVVLTGTDSGPIQITLHIRTQPPSDTELSLWDEVVEVSLRVGDDPFGISTVDDLDGDAPFPVLPAGDLRVRFHARGRDVAAESVTIESAVEFHLLIAWPAAAEPERVLRHIDRFGDRVKTWNR